METKTLGSAVVIKVNDFALCDNFYRDVLGLGDPEFTSSFGSFYRLSETTGLYLLKSGLTCLEHGSAAVSWSFVTPDLAALEKRLKEAELPLDKEIFHLGFEEYRRGLDPENNPFFVREEKP